MGGTRGRPERAATVDELADQARKAVLELAQRPELAAFEALLDLSRQVGESLGESARLMAAHGSWSEVADVAGTSKQAAWSRWRG